MKITLKFKLLFVTGTPLVNICVWAVLRYHTHYHAHPGPAAEQEAAVSEEERMAINLISNCPFFVEDAIDHFVYNLPVFILLACNIFFLVWIMIVRFSPCNAMNGATFFATYM